MRLIERKLDIPEGYAIVQQPKEWSDDDEFIELLVPKLDTDSCGNTIYTELSDSSLLQISNDFKVTSWLIEQSPRLRGCSRFLIGVQLNERGFYFEPIYSRKSIEDSHVWVKIKLSQIIAYYPMNTKL